MRRGVTVLVVVVVAAIALAAGFDALRGGSAAEPAAQRATEPPTTSTAETTETSPPEPELGGVLYYTDESCELQAVELPEPRPVEAPGWDECRFVLSPHRRRVAGPGSGWDPRSDPLIGRLFQSEDGRIQVSTNRGPEGEPFAGEAPAWRPDRTLTYFADRAVRVWPEGEAILSQDDLAEAVRAHPDVPDHGHVRPVSVRELAWLGDERAVVILDAVIRSGAPQSLLAVFDGRRLSTVTAGDGNRLSDLSVSSRGGFIAVRSEDDFLLLDERGNVLPAPSVAGYRTIAWSPDEQWVAVAAEQGVFVFRPGLGEPPELELDLDAQDLDWRGEAGPPPLTDVDEAREWLDGLATGRLLVTLPGCRLRALRLPDLVWEGEPDVPAPCRFTVDADGAVLAESVSTPAAGDLTASCEGPDLHVYQDRGFRARLPSACGPAWMEDGTLTFIRDGGLWRGVEDARRLLSREQVSAIVRRPSALEEVAWVDEERFWAVVRSEGSSILALMTAERLVFTPSFTSRAIEGLHVSSSSMVAARSDQGVVIFDSAGRRALTFLNGKAVAWEPGELIAAVATPSEILFVAPVSREVVSVPLAVSDLEWVIP